MKIVDGNKIVTTDRYYTIFNLKTGLEVSSGINGYPDPFSFKMPSLLDVGIMGHCDNNCKICYQGSKREPNMSLDNYKTIIDSCKDYTNQIALGGRGDPNLHENFENIVKYTRENNVIPNYTTSGINLSQRQIEVSKEYCGAVAVSNYNKFFTFNAIDRLIKAGVKTNIHWVLSQDTYTDIMNTLSRENKWLEGINAIIFLLFKPKGKGEQYKDLQLTEEQIQNVITAMRAAKQPWKIGTDSCTVRFFQNMSEEEKLFSDFCEAGRMSAYITPDMKMKPCSFMDEIHEVKIEENRNIFDIWNNSKSFKICRKKLLDNPRCCPALI